MSKNNSSQFPGPNPVGLNNNRKIQLIERKSTVKYPKQGIKIMKP